MSAIGTKRTFVFALRMSAFGGKADIKNLGEFAKGVAESKIFPSFAFRFEPPDPSLLMLIHDTSTPKCVTLALVRTFHSVAYILNFLGHGSFPP